MKVATGLAIGAAPMAELAAKAVASGELPIIGFYGNGEIAPINGINELLQYSAVLGLFTARNITH